MTGRRGYFGHRPEHRDAALNGQKDKALARMRFLGRGGKVYDYKIIDEIYKELRRRGYTIDETIKWLIGHKALTPSGQQSTGLSTIKLKEVLREARKEVRMY